MQKVIDFAVSNGFVVCKSSGHHKIKLGKAILTLSSSPSCPHAHTNAQKDVERILKEHNERSNA